MFFIKTININLDFYKEFCYDEINEWDKLWKFDNPYDLPVAYVDFKDKRLNPDIPKNAFRCPTNGKKLGEITCSMCKACWNKKIKNVVFEQH